jgi:hypothetical protein
MTARPQARRRDEARPRRGRPDRRQPWDDEESATGNFGEPQGGPGAAQPGSAQPGSAQPGSTQAGSTQAGSTQSSGPESGPAATGRGGHAGDQSPAEPARSRLTTDNLMAVPDEAVARRTATGWRVGGEEVPDLTSAMVLADLLAADLPIEEQWQDPGRAAAGLLSTASEPAPPQQGAGAEGTTAHGPGAPPARTPAAGRPAAGRPAEAPAADAEQLKETVAQLERALTVRVRVEQAIGVLAERHKLRPRQAFELLRSASRARGARVSQTAGEVVASVTNPLLRIPEELARQPEGHRGRTPRHSRRKS